MHSWLPIGCSDLTEHAVGAGDLQLRSGGPARPRRAVSAGGVDHPLPGPATQLELALADAPGADGDGELVFVAARRFGGAYALDASWQELGIGELVRGLDFLIVGLADPLAAASLARVSPDDVVGAFVAAIEAHDVDAAGSMMSEGISYENMPMAPISGRTAVASTLRGFLSPASTVDWRIVRQWTVDRTVINERLDRFQIGAGWLELPVVGIFEIDESDQIVLWRDYFDMNAYTSQFAELTGS